MTITGLNFEKRFIKALEVMCAIPVSIIVLITFFDVFARYLFSAPIKGSVEIVEFSMAAVVFIALPLVTRKRMHISVSLFDGFFSGRSEKIKLGICDLLSAAALSLLTWRLYTQAMEEWEFGTQTLVLGIPHWPLYFSITLFSGLATLLVTIMAVQNLFGEGSAKC